MKKEELEKWIAMHKEDIEDVKSYWDEIPPTQLSGVYSDFSRKSQYIGIYNTLLGNRQEASNWFKKSTDYSINEIKHTDRSRGKNYIKYTQLEISYYDSIFPTILTQDEEFMKNAAKWMCEQNEDISQMMKSRGRGEKFLCCYAFSLANLIIGNNDKARELLDEMGKTRPLSYTHPIGDATRGILEKNPELTKEGINKILKTHNRILKGLSQEEKLVCIPAVCMLILAKLKGINIKDIYIESKYIPKSLFEK